MLGDILTLPSGLKVPAQPTPTFWIFMSRVLPRPIKTLKDSISAFVKAAASSWPSVFSLMCSMTPELCVEQRQPRFGSADINSDVTSFRHGDKSRVQTVSEEFKIGRN